MSATLKIYCKNLEEYIPINGGETLAAIYSEKIGLRLGFRPICAKVNNRTEDLSFPVFAPRQVEYLDETSPSGARVYVRSLCMILYKAVTDVCPGFRLRIEHSLSRGYYCRLSDAAGKEFTPDAATVDDLRERMRRIVEADSVFTRKERMAKDVVELFKAQGLDDKVRLIDTLHDLYWIFYRMEGVNDSYYGALAPSTGYIDTFDLVCYKDGFLLLGKDTATGRAARPVEQEKMYHAFTDYLRFNRIIKVSDVGELNVAVREKRTASLINVAEAMHDKYLGRISDRIVERSRENGAQVVFIAGPSSSGKTTSTKRLAIQLMTGLMTPKMISLDNYFVDRERTPRDESGDYDYESLYALDLERLNSDLRTLLDGRAAEIPFYSFELGRRTERTERMKLDPGDVLLIEGIHGLNPELSAGIPADDKFKIYVSALTTLSIDDHNWIPTTDNRLLRRIVRDFKYRHTSAYETLRRWPSVRRGEEKWIFPFQENADAMFNSSLIFELGVMKDYAMPLLRDVPRDMPEYSEAHRLMRFLSLFESIPAEQVPSTSLLREFLGGSSFRY